MAAAEESKLKGGKLIETEQIFSKAKKRAGNISFR
jgi:hypothetical protein